MKNPIRRRTSAASRGSFLTGCLIALAVVVVLCVAGGLFIMTQWRGWAATAVTAGITAGVEELDLSDQDEQLILTRVDDLAADFKSKDVTMVQLAQVAENIFDSPLVPVIAVYAVEKNYFDDSGLSDEEKADASLQLQRLARGGHEDKITVEEMQDAMDEIVLQSAGNNNMQFRDPETVDDDDLRQLITEVKAAADKAEIPNEPFKIDIAAEFIKAIDEALGEGPAITEAVPVDADEGAGEEHGEEGAGEHEEGGEEEAGGEHEGGAEEGGGEGGGG